MLDAEFLVLLFRTFSLGRLKLNSLYDSYEWYPVYTCLLEVWIRVDALILCVNGLGTRLSTYVP